jgi:hypothetical protein
MEEHFLEGTEGSPKVTSMVEFEKCLDANEPKVDIIIKDTIVHNTETPIMDSNQQTISNTLKTLTKTTSKMKVPICMTHFSSKFLEFTSFFSKSHLM